MMKIISIKVYNQNPNSTSIGSLDQMKVPQFFPIVKGKVVILTNRNGPKVFYFLDNNHAIRNDVHESPKQQKVSLQTNKCEENQYEEKSNDSQSFEDCISVQDICYDTEAAIYYMRNLLRSSDHSPSYLFPPIIFLHQLRDVVTDKTSINRQIELLKNEKKIVLIHLGNEENMRVVVCIEDLRNNVLSKCRMSEKLVYEKFFDQVLNVTVDIGVTRTDLVLKYHFSEKEIRLLVNSGLLILKETGIFWFSFPYAGVFMKKMIKGRQALLHVIRKRKYQEILEQDIKRIPINKSLKFPIMYHVHDLVGGKFVNSIQTSSGRLLRFGR